LRGHARSSRLLRETLVNLHYGLVSLMKITSRSGSVLSV
jgi:hypothetical protein